MAFISFYVPDNSGRLLSDFGEQYRFWSKIQILGPDECWPWISNKNNLGYGQFNLGPKVYLAHRCAYMDCIGEIPPRMVIRHTCDMRACCNPGHLLLGTQKQNIHDAISRGRMKFGFPLEKHRKPTTPSSPD